MCAYICIYVIVFTLVKKSQSSYSQIDFQQILFMSNDKREWNRGTGVNLKFM